MPRKFTTLLLIGLMLALPLRAVAGMAMLGCASAQQMAGLVSAEHHADSSAMQAMTGCHEGKQAASSMHDHCQHDHGSSGKHGGGACNACCDCCVGVMSLPAAAFSVSHPEPASTFSAFITHPYNGFQPEGPERPPRHALS